MPPDCFRDRLPDSIKKIRDDLLPESDTNYDYQVEYVYSIKDQDGKPVKDEDGWLWNVSLGFVFGTADIVPKAGSEVCLRGVWVRVVSVVADPPEDYEGRVITWHEAMVEEMEEKGK